MSPAPPALVFHDTGRGPVLLMLHAFPLDASQWDNQVAAFSGHWRCVRPDMWGCGVSPELPAPMEASLDGYAESLLKWLDGSGVAEVVAVGSSMGGYACFALLRRAPSRIRALVLASSRAIADTPEQAANRRRMAELALRDGSETAVSMVNRLLASRARGDPHVLDPVVGRIRRCRPAGIAASQIAMAGRPDSTALLAAVEVPALVVAGDDDGIVSLEEARGIADALPRGQLAVLPGSGHLGNLEDPVGFNEVVGEFLNRLG
ncbi:MAG TPA: alpha/beta hydrolase [Candidatus Binatia bacterium]|nr:alpha/beta hydrolase [Candidatus Binatia bacterium]